jgi:hypothetical protein
MRQKATRLTPSRNRLDIIAICHKLIDYDIATYRRPHSNRNHDPMVNIFLPKNGVIMSKQNFKKNADPELSELQEALALLRLAASKKALRRNITTSGILLGKLSRENSRETRYSWDVVNGNGYLRIQDFQFDVRDKSWTPVRGRCFSVRIHELAYVKGFVQEAIDHALGKAQADIAPTAAAQDEDLVIEPLNRDLRDVK